MVCNLVFNLSHRRLGVELVWVDPWLQELLYFLLLSLANCHLEGLNSFGGRLIFIGS